MRFSHEEIVSKFKAMYHVDCLVIKSPGRINLLGEHVDYNDGFVMPAAINYAALFGIAEAKDGISEIYSIQYNQTISVDLGNIKPVEKPKWANYLLGVIRQFIDKGHKLKPFKCVFGGDVPLGAGLSSSAALECGFAYALNELNQLQVPKSDLIYMAQWSEHHYVGVKCGIMDQFASMMGKDDHVIVLDCRSMEYHYSPLKLAEHSIVLCDTKVKHSLVDSQYNKRRTQCEEGLSALSAKYPQVKSFRDVTEQMMAESKSSLPELVYNRCLFVVQEIARVQQGSKDLQSNQIKAFGEKMFATHHGLSKLYEVSCKELDFLVDEAKKFKSVLGARMMGGGFGGCTINIIENASVQEFIKVVSEKYLKQFNIEMVPYFVTIEKGTHVVGNKH